MSILSVKNLEKKFGDLTVLKNISFNINDGEIISIIGFQYKIFEQELQDVGIVCYN